MNKELEKMMGSQRTPKTILFNVKTRLNNSVECFYDGDTIKSTEDKDPMDKKSKREEMEEEQ